MAPAFVATPTALAAPSVPAAWSAARIDEAEAAVLRALAPDTAYTKRRIPVTSPHGPAYMNALSAGSASSPPLVLLHGWGSGAALFGRDLAGLAAVHRVHLVDWLGFGASSRPAFCTGWGPEEAEDFFLDALEEVIFAMRESGELGEDFHVVGHSMGAFLAVGYALRHPRDVRNLVLASPVGVPRRPLNKFPPPSAPWMKRLVFWACFALWDRHWTPQVVIRHAPTERIGRMLAGRLMAPRFPAGVQATRDAIVEYFYQTCVAPASAEHSLSTVLESGAYARRPLVDKLPKVQVPVRFLYGDRDWMDWKGAEAVGKTMKVETGIDRLDDAGHHLYYDNPDQFCRFVIDACTAAREVPGDADTITGNMMREGRERQN